MPWTQPKSLTKDEVYAVTAFLLNLGGVVPDDFTLSDRNIADTQKLMPNRNGMSTDHGLWPGKGLGNGGRPDVKAAACMKDCAAEPKVVSSLPDFARNAHGNLAEQSRLVGAQRGADTTRPAPKSAAAALAMVTAAATTAAKPAAEVNTAVALTRKHACVACHDMNSRVVGPSFREIAGKHAGRADAVAYLAGKIRTGGAGSWGNVPMPPQALGEADATAIAQWLADAPRP
jgi:cytochrome c551/c552